MRTIRGTYEVNGEIRPGIVVVDSDDAGTYVRFTPNSNGTILAEEYCVRVKCDEQTIFGISWDDFDFEKAQQATKLISTDIS